MRRTGSVMVIALMAAGCASSGQLKSAHDESSVMLSSTSNGTQALRYFADATVVTDTITLSAATAWPRLVSAYNVLGIPLTGVDTALHRVGAIRVRVGDRLGGRPLSAYLDCGRTSLGAPRADEYQVTLTALSQITTSADSATLVNSVVSGTAVDPSSSSTAAQCGSTGALERRIAEIVNH